MSDPRIAPPGHHGTSSMTGPNAIVLSERAAAVLQGFPPDWVFVGKTKRARWAQLGMAMPPPLAHAVGAEIPKPHQPRENRSEMAP
jgi:site-specific DNA-cytosine methylase